MAGMKKQNSLNSPSSIQYLFILMTTCWSLIIAFLLIWNISAERKKTKTILLSQARPFFQQIVTTRYWNALHGGVYVPITEKNKPNPFLTIPDRDIETKNGLSLTLINPAYMTRQIAELALERDQVSFHITSNTPIRPANAPEEWESNALNSFLSKQKEYYEWWTNKNGSRFFRYMAPLWTKQPCLKCHEAKLQQSEDLLRGGISVTIPAESILTNQDNYIKLILLIYVFIWTLGFLGLSVSCRYVKKGLKQREDLVKQLEKTLRGFLPICSSCKSIREDDGKWAKIEKYIHDHSDVKFTHSICPDCAKKLYPDLNLYSKGQ